MLLCPQCKTGYEQRGTCPECGERLVTRERGGGPPRPARWQHTPWGRILIGVIFAQGLWFGGRQLLKGVCLGFLPEGSSPAHVPALFLLYQAVQILTLVIACILAAVGQRPGMFIGTVVGVCSGLLSVLLQPFLDMPVSPVYVLGLPIILTVFGAVAGWVGCTFWKPLPLAAVPGPVPSTDQQGRAPTKIPLFTGKVAWLRVVVGVFLAVAGTLSASLIFDKALYVSAGHLVPTYGVIDKIIVWEIKALALIIGGAFAGANTFNGLKQGLVVALASTSILIGLQFNAAEQVLEFVVYTAIGAICLCIVGGWFGCQLFPPVLKIPRRRQGFGPASI